jgi:uncharacterized protein YjiS (DUF1127 family)
MLIALTALLQRIHRFFYMKDIEHGTKRELYKLSNRDLHDLGINRGDIDYIAEKAARDKANAKFAL